MLYEPVVLVFHDTGINIINLIIFLVILVVDGGAHGGTQKCVGITDEWQYSWCYKDGGHLSKY